MRRTLSIILIGTAWLLASRSPLLSQETGAPHGSLVSHRVKAGESLFQIALRYNCSYPAISRANGIRNPNAIREGTTLVIPTFMILPQHQSDEAIVLNLPEFRLYHFRAEKEPKIDPICIGLKTWQTPVGPFEVLNKTVNPTWYMPEEMAARLNIKKEVVPPGPLNPLGDRWIGISLKHIGIHSTNDPMSIGKLLSHGCVRLYPNSARELFDAVSVKDKGKIVYEPIKVTVWQDEIYLEAHEDVYQRVADYKKEFARIVDSLGLNGNTMDREIVEKTLKERRGVPVVIGKGTNGLPPTDQPH